MNKYDSHSKRVLLDYVTVVVGILKIDKIFVHMRTFIHKIYLCFLTMLQSPHDSVLYLVFNT
jgi:hypothetical protein